MINYLIKYHPFGWSLHQNSMEQCGTVPLKKLFFFPPFPYNRHPQRSNNPAIYCLCVAQTLQAKSFLCLSKWPQLARRSFTDRKSSVHNKQRQAKPHRSAAKTQPSGQSVNQTILSVILNFLIAFVNTEMIQTPERWFYSSKNEPLKCNEHNFGAFLLVVLSVS